VGAPVPGVYTELLNTDATVYGGSNLGNSGGVEAKEIPWHEQPCSLELTLPPLACVWFSVPG
jgi:1,4-alpha-glucan branching enzyme